MKIDVNKQSKVVALWFCNQENPQEDLPPNIEKEIEEYRKKKYRICMYQSGNDDMNFHASFLFFLYNKNVFIDST